MADRNDIVNRCKRYQKSYCIPLRNTTFILCRSKCEKTQRVRANFICELNMNICLQTCTVFIVFGNDFLGILDFFFYERTFSYYQLIKILAWESQSYCFYLFDQTMGWREDKKNTNTQANERLESLNPFEWLFFVQFLMQHHMKNDQLVDFW